MCTLWNLSCLAVGVNTTASKANDLEKRLISFAAAIVRLSSTLPRTPQGRHICGQILRSATSAAANYGEARGAESRADFIHKLKVVFKELNETTIWLEVIAESSLLSAETIVGIYRGKPPTLQNHCGFHQDGSCGDRMIGGRQYWVNKSIGGLNKYIKQRTTTN